MEFGDICELTSQNIINAYYLKVENELNFESDNTLKPQKIELVPISDKMIIHENPALISIFIGVEKPLDKKPKPKY
jgi:hypothetical protein